MLFKLRQQLSRHTRTVSNYSPDTHSRKFIINYLRHRRLLRTSGALRASLGIVRWMITTSRTNTQRFAFRSSCYLTGRGRGVSRRFSVSRTKIKHIASLARLFGVRKSSW